jgi:glycosyltransferase involved in cell wall biosynthesis
MNYDEQYQVRGAERKIPGDPKVTMVISAYQRPTQIMVTLSSLLAQTHQNFEILVVHDGPGPEVKKVVEGLSDARVRFLETSERKNDWGNSAKEWGSHQATGEWIGHSNDDNYYAPGYFELMVNACLNNQAQFAYCNMLHSHLLWAPFPTQPRSGALDGGAWICRTEIVNSTAWPENKADTYADGFYIDALVARCKVAKVNSFLLVHN